MLHALLLGLAIQDKAVLDTLLLPIGNPGTVRADIDRIVRTKDGRMCSAAEVAAAADGKSYVFLGESHTTASHHQMQADIIRELVNRGRNVVVGMEMFTRPVQKDLAGWTLGRYTDEQFIERSDWKKQWGYDYLLYKPIFDVAKEKRLPLVALNVPRDWVRAVGRGGFSGLTAEQKADLPSDLDLKNANHRRIVQSMTAGHPMTGNVADTMYSAQVLWDEGMADTAIKYMRGRTASPNTVFVVVAGSGHVMYGQGINWRIKKHTGKDGVTVVMTEAKESRAVARGLGDFVYLTKEEPAAK